MRTRLKQAYVEWGFVALLGMLCAILSGLQYRWTGEVSRAEAEHLRSGINVQAQQFCRAFDSALRENCNSLVPHDETVNDHDREAIHVQLFKQWKAIHPRPLFSQVAVAVPTYDGVQLFVQSQTTGKLERMSWSPDWNGLRESFEHRERRDSPPFADSAGELIEFPVFGGPPGNAPPPDDGGPPPGGGNPPEREWVIFELATNYICIKWLPELIQTYLNPDGQTLYDVDVKTIASPNTVIFSSSADAANNSETPVTVAFNQQGRDPQNYRGPSPDFRWRLEVRPRPGGIDAIVSASHRRNLAVAILLNGLILAAGFALVRHTRRSRQLVEQQLNFVASVSHELRTPLTVIRGAAHNIQRGIVSERNQIEKYCGFIIGHCEQLTDMIEQVLALAGAQKGNSTALRQPVALAEVLNNAVSATAQDTEAAHCEVQLELPPVLPSVTGDASALRRVFQNLITNAAKHGGSGGWIGITASSETNGKPPMIEIRVADRGPGIPASEFPEIFKPFFRGEAAQSMQIRGSGLGLSLVKEIVEAHGGTILAENNKGPGAVFVVRLPAATTE